MPKNIHGKLYITVAERLAAFHEAHKDAAIETMIEFVDGKTVRVRAKVWPNHKEQTRFATGHAEEVRGSTTINKTSAVENAETSAVGRALANLGIAIEQGIASADEVEGAKNREAFLTEPTIVDLPEEPTRMPKVMKTCSKCGKAHNGKYAKCLDCWKLDKESTQ
jgi:hypothetical protein